MSRTTKWSSRLLSPRATCSLSFQTERIHASAFSDQTKYFLILVAILKYIVLISCIIPGNLSIELRYILYTLSNIIVKEHIVTC